MPTFLGVDIAAIVNSALGSLLYDGTLTRKVPGVRTPGAPSSGTNTTTETYTFKGMASVYAQTMKGVGPTEAIAPDQTRLGEGQILIVANSGTMPGIEPKPGDQITLTGDPQLGSRVATIAVGGVSRDPASATWICEVRF